MLQSNKRTGASAIRDGMGNTFLLFESAGKPYRYQDGKTYVDWSLPNGDIEKINLLANDAFTQWSNWKASMKINPGAGADDDDNPYLNWNKDKFINHTNIGEVYSFHPDGAMILYGDGAVKFESEDMDPAVFINRFTRNGGEVEYRD
jgi:prepilin-type processing-associated H-X9-DG protein